MLEQHAELVAAEPRQRVALAQPRTEQHGDLAQELVARRVPARVVDELELVEIEVQHGVIDARVARRRPGPCSAGVRIRAD